LFIGDPVPLVLRGKLGPVDISAVSVKIEALLDEKIEGVAITAPIIEGDEAGGRVDLSAIDFEKLAQMFASRPRTGAGDRLRRPGGREVTRVPTAKVTF
jgi:type I restriction enzyme R subunit